MENQSEITLTKKIIVYFVSIFLPPFGLWYAVKYFKAGDYESRKLAIAAVILTLLSTIITLWMSLSVINSLLQSFSSIQNLNN